MNVRTVTTADGSSRSAAGRWSIESPVGATPLRFFRQVLRLRFETGGAADGIRVDPDTTVLKAAFLPYDYDALEPGELRASLTGSGGTVTATLDAPRQVRQVRLAPSVPTGSTLEFHRLDGETPTETPTVAAAVKRLNPEAMILAAGISLQSSGASVFAAPGGMANVISASGRGATLPAGVDFTDGRFAIRLAGSAGSTLAAADLTGLHIRSYPTGPRLGISTPEDPGSAVFFWRADGEVGKAVPPDLGEVDAGSEFASVLQRHLDDFSAGLSADAGGPLPEIVEVALVLESDSPCLLDVSDFDLSYYLVRESFISGEEKMILRFTGGETVAHEVPLEIPGNATVTSATLSVVESFGSDGLVLAEDGEVSEAFPVRKEGIHLGAERWVAQPIVPTKATSASGIAVALMATAGGAEVLLELREDWHGRPAGRTLGGGRIAPGGAGRRMWATLLFPEPVTIPSSPHWVLMTAAAGGAVWLTDAGDLSVRTLEKPDSSSVGAESVVFEGMQAMYRFLSRGERAGERQQVSLTIGEYAVEEPTVQDGRKIYDLTTAIGDYLDSLPTTDPVATVTLALTSVLRGLITVAPPLIEYDLG